MSSSNKTQRLELNQWSLTDALRMEDFNRDNQLIDEAFQRKASLAYGSYTGDGRYGSDGPTGFMLDFTPVMIAISGKGGSADEPTEVTAILIKGRTESGYTVSVGGQAKNVSLSCRWNGTLASFYAPSTGSNTAAEQLNISGEVYNYVAIGL